MADIFVDSGASGANDGTSKTDAYLTLKQAEGQVADGNIYVSHTHAETGTSTVVLSFTTANRGNPVRVISINFSDDSVTPGASITSTGINDHLEINGWAWIHGLTFNIDEEILIGTVNSQEHRLTFEQCTFGHGSSSDANRQITVGPDDSTDPRGAYIEFRNCTFNPEANPLILGYRAFLHFVGCTFNLETATGFIFPRQGGYARFDSCDLAGDATPTTMWVFSDEDGKFAGRVHLLNCNLPSDTITESGEDNSLFQELLIENSAAGAITDPALGLVHYRNPYGKIECVLTPHRVAGADDEEQANPFSWKISTNSNCKRAIKALVSPPLSRWIPGAWVGLSVTATIYFADSHVLSNDQIYFLWFTPASGGSPTAKPDCTFTRIADPLGTPVEHTAASGAGAVWSGSGIGRKYKNSVTFTPAVAGWVVVRAFVAWPGEDIFLDPYMDLSV